MLKIVNVFELGNDPETFPIEIKGSPAWADHLLESLPFSELEVEVLPEDILGVTALRLAAGSRYPAHTHQGHHTLLILSGRGTVDYKGVRYQTRPGDMYVMDGATEHAVGAIDDHVLLSIGVPYRHPGTPERMRITE